MRMIDVSTEVYAAIWAARKIGEENEDAVLSRILNVRTTEPELLASKSSSTSVTGVYDSRSGTNFPEGFRIFRRYKGQEYVAVASGGSWRRDDNREAYPTLNQLNSSIVAGQENVWNGNWKYRTATGIVHSIASLRGKTSIQAS